MEKTFDLIVKRDPKSPVSESYREIRTNIRFANVDSNVKKILVTSSVAGEGKSTTISNLACTLADEGNRVLLLDCDLRKPTLHKKFSVRNHMGLMDVLIEKSDYKNYIQPIYDGLDLLTTGSIPSNPSEILGSNSMKQLVEEMSREYDYVLIDTAPIVAVTDPLVIASYIDGIILVIRAESTPVDLVKSSVDKLEKVNAKIIGSILNGTETKKGYDYYSYKRYGVE